MNAPRDIKDRVAKRILRHPRMIQDMLSDFVPPAWVEDVRLGSLRELPAELIGPRGDKRLGDILWLADREAGRRLVVMAEHQSAPGRRMAARMAMQTGLLYETLRGELRGPDGLPALLSVVVYAGDRAWGEAEDLAQIVEPSALPMVIAGRRYLLLDLARIASERSVPENRFFLLAQLTCASSWTEAADLLTDATTWLDLQDEEEERLLLDLVNWFYALTPQARPGDWDPDEHRVLEETMGRLTTLEVNNRRAFERKHNEGLALGRRQGIEQGRRQGVEQGRRQGVEQGRRQGVEQQRAMLARLAERRFGLDWGRRLDAALRRDPGKLERAADLIVDCATGEQLLGGLNGAGPRT